MKSTRSTLLLATAFAACALSAQVVRAGTVCPDDPERCVERGATVQRGAGVVTSASHATPTPAASVVATTAQHKPAVPARKPAAKAPAHAATRTTPTPVTPGMGMLLKMSGGTGGDVTWFPSRPTENSTGASWVL